MVVIVMMTHGEHTRHERTTLCIVILTNAYGRNSDSALYNRINIGIKSRYKNANGWSRRKQLCSSFVLLPFDGSILKLINIKYFSNNAIS